jgi:hypothetical protein
VVQAPGIMNSRALTDVQEDDLKMAAVESKQEVEQAEEDKDEENPTPGAVRVSGVNSRDSTLKWQQLRQCKKIDSIDC